jgi:ferritin
MLNDKMTDALNGQVNRELFSSYLYLSMSAFFESLNQKGMASWMRVQAGEELVHAMKIYDYIISSGSRAKMLAVEAPKSSWASPIEAFQHVWDHERAVTTLINNLVALAVQEKDEASKNFLQWYLDEQVEEEESSDKVLTKVKNAGKDLKAIEAVDKELGLRRFKFPKGYEIFPYTSQQGITIGALKK